MTIPETIVPLGTSGAASLPEAVSYDSFSEAFEAYLSETDVAASTKSTYRKAFRRFASWLSEGGVAPSGVTAKHIMDYKSSLQRSRLSSLTVNSYLIALRGFYSWLDDRGAYPDITRRVKVSRGRGCGEDFIKMHLTPEEQSELLEYYRTRNVRDYAIVALLLGTGVRLVEVTRMDVGDMTRMRGRDVILLQGKGHTDKDSLTVLRPDVRQIISDYMDKCRPGAVASDPLFETMGYGHQNRVNRQGVVDTAPNSGGRMSVRSLEKIVKRGLRAIGLDGHEYSSHSLRHTFAVNLLKAGVPMADIQKAMRHTSINTTLIYLKSIEKETRLDDAPELRAGTAFPRHSEFAHKP